MSKFPLFGILKHRIIFLENTSTSELEADVWREKCQTFAAVKPAIPAILFFNHAPLFDANSPYA
jgi:hypothetical protein